MNCPSTLLLSALLASHALAAPAPAGGFALYGQGPSNPEIGVAFSRGAVLAKAGAAFSAGTFENVEERWSTTMRHASSRGKLALGYALPVGGFELACLGFFTLGRVYQEYESVPESDSYLGVSSWTSEGYSLGTGLEILFTARVTDRVKVGLTMEAVKLERAYLDSPWPTLANDGRILYQESTELTAAALPGFFLAFGF